MLFAMISWNTWPREQEYLQISSMVFVNKDVVKPNLNILLQYVPWSTCNQHIFANSFFPWCVKHWNKLLSDEGNIKD